MSPISRRRVAQFVADQLAAGESVARVARVLAAWLVDSRQTRTIEMLLLDIESELLRRHGHLTADVVSARELSADTRTNLINELKKLTSAKTVEILPKTDSSLLGGMIVRTPDAEMDASLRTKLSKLRAV